LYVYPSDAATAEQKRRSREGMIDRKTRC